MNKNCQQCKSNQFLEFEISMAFQPIVDLYNFDYYGYEALVRGPNGEGAGSIFEKVNDDNRYLFDQKCRQKAIELAAKLNLKKFLCPMRFTSQRVVFKRP
jgi:EAL domain-containing protein (putative c-di-GMP-specific phosphodiesterase class I)